MDTNFGWYSTDSGTVFFVECCTQERKCDTPRSVCHISALFLQDISLCHDPDTTATLSASDSNAVAVFLTVKMWKVWQ
jgi:hypothetical protein